jgi:hypothetical protein
MNCPVDEGSAAQGVRGSAAPSGSACAATRALSGTSITPCLSVRPLGPPVRLSRTCSRKGTAVLLLCAPVPCFYSGHARTGGCSVLIVQVPFGWTVACTAQHIAFLQLGSQASPRTHAKNIPP